MAKKQFNFRVEEDVKNKLDEIMEWFDSNSNITKNQSMERLIEDAYERMKRDELGIDIDNYMKLIDYKLNFICEMIELMFKCNFEYVGYSHEQMDARVRGNFKYRSSVQEKINSGQSPFIKLLDGKKDNS